MISFTESFIFLCWAILFVVMVMLAFSGKRTVETDRWWRWSWWALAIFIALILLFEYFIRSPVSPNDVTLWPHIMIVDIVAGIVVFIGLAIALWGRITLGRNWSMLPSFKEHHELIESGPYAYVRHPMYTGLLLMFLGTVIWYGMLAGLIIFIFSFLGTWFKLSQEQKMLTKHFGDSYLAYKRRVKALIPFIW